MRCIEDIAVFYRRKPTYNPQGLERLAEPRASGEADSVITPFSGQQKGRPLSGTAFLLALVIIPK